MFILQHLLTELKSEFDLSRKGEERGLWFIYTVMAIIIPFTSSKTSNLLRSLKALFGCNYSACSFSRGLSYGIRHSGM